MICLPGLGPALNIALVVAMVGVWIVFALLEARVLKE